MTQVQNFNVISVQRISQLPIVESSVSAANLLYQKFKNVSPIVNWTLNITEATISRAAEKATPLVSQFQGPIKRVDTFLCTSLDFVEDKVPAVKLPPNELFGNMIYYINDNVISYFYGNSTPMSQANNNIDQDREMEQENGMIPEK